MQITLELPDDVAQGLEAQVKNLPRALLESFAVEGYRSGKLTGSRCGGFWVSGHAYRLTDF